MALLAEMEYMVLLVGCTWKIVQLIITIALRSSYHTRLTHLLDFLSIDRYSLSIKIGSIRFDYNDYFLILIGMFGGEYFILRYDVCSLDMTVRVEK